MENKDVDLLWEAVVVDLMPMISTVSYQIWISGVKPLKIYNNKLVLSVQLHSNKTQLDNVYRDKIVKCIRKNSDFVDDFIVVLQDEESSLEESQAQPLAENAEKSAAQAEDAPFESTRFKSSFTFDNFVVGESNQLVYAAAKTVAEEPGKRYNPLFIYGGVGLGKTHIMHAIGNYIASTRPDLKVRYAAAETFTNDFIESIRTNKDSGLNRKFRDNYRNVDVLMLDDIQSIAKKPGTQEALFHTFNYLIDNEKQIVFSSDRHPSLLNNIEDRLISRFAAGITVDISPPGLREAVPYLGGMRGIHSRKDRHQHPRAGRRAQQSGVLLRDEQARRRQHGRGARGFARRDRRRGQGARLRRHFGRLRCLFRRAPRRHHGHAQEQADRGGKADGGLSHL